MQIANPVLVKVNNPVPYCSTFMFANPLIAESLLFAINSLTVYNTS